MADVHIEVMVVRCISSAEKVLPVHHAVCLPSDAEFISAFELLTCVMPCGFVCPFNACAGNLSLLGDF